MNEEERNLSAISHLGVVLPIFGLGLIFFIYLSKKEKSEPFKFQLLQSFTFQFLELLFVVFMIILYLVSIFGSLIFATLLPQTGQPIISSIFPLFVSIFFFLGLLVFIFSGGFASLTIFAGKEFNYPFISIFLKKFMGKREEDQSN